MASTSAAVLMLALVASMGGAAAKLQQQEAVAVNPIRKVVTMLQAMEKKVTAEGEKEKELFDKFMCYCKNGDEALAKSISDAERKAPALAADIQAAEDQVKQLKLDL